jgi:hypothetical protein
VDRPDRDNARDGVRLPPRPPLLPDGEYLGVIIRVERGRAPWPPRKLRVGEKERRQDWHAYYHIELRRGIAPDKHDALRADAQRRGTVPVVFYACRYTTGRRDDIPFPVLPSSHLYKLLIMTRPGTSIVGDTIPFSSPVGWEVRIRLGTRERDHDGDPLPASMRCSVVRKVLQALPPGTNFQASSQPSPSSNQPSVSSNQPSASSKQRSTVSEEQHSRPIDRISRDFSQTNGNGTPVASDTASHHGRLHEVSRATAPAGPQSEGHAGADADPEELVGGYVAPEELSSDELAARRRRMFGRHAEVSPRGPCRYCGDLKLGRPGEDGRCLRCEGASRQ